MVEDKTKAIVGGIVAVVAIIAIAYLESLALQQGIDGWFFSLAIGLIAGIGGYVVKEWLPFISSWFRGQNGR